MIKKTNVNRNLTVGIVLLFLGMALSASASQPAGQQDDFLDEVTSVTVVQTFSPPILKDEGQYATIYVEIKDTQGNINRNRAGLRRKHNR